MLIPFSSGCIKASAALSGGRFLTPTETLAILGDSLNVQYYDGSGTQTTVARYIGTDTAQFDETYQTTDYLQDGLATLVYSFTGNVSNNPQYTVVEFPAEFVLLDVDQVHTIAGISANAYSGIPVDPYSTPQWRWTMAGQSVSFSGRADYGFHYRAILAETTAPNCQFDYIPVDWSHNGTTSAFSQRLYFSYAEPVDNVYYIAVGVPYITDTGTVDTISGTSGTGTSGTGNITIDMSETNGLLGGIKDILSGIVDGIAGIFVPDQDFLLDWKDDMGGILDDTFGKYTEIDDLLDRVKDTLVNTQPNAVVRFPGIHPPGSSFSIPAQDVNAVPPALADFVDYIKFGFDILATCLFVNSCKRKWDEVVLGKTVVEIEGSD